MNNRLLHLAALVAATLVAGGCLGGDRPSGDPGEGPAASADPLASTSVSQDGLTLSVELDRWEVAPGGHVVARVTLRNDRPVPVEYGGGCQPVTWTVKLALPIEPDGLEWPGLAGEFKTYAMTEGLGPGGVPALDPVDTSPPLPACDFDPGRSNLQPGQSFEWTLTWRAEIVAGVPALPGAAPFTISIAYDPEQSGNLMFFKQLIVPGTIALVGEAPRPLTAGQAIDVVLSDARFAAWLTQFPRGSWANANVFLQSWPKAEGIVPAGPAWDIELFREPRNWAIAYVQPYTGELKLNFCNVPCDR